MGPRGLARAQTLLPCPGPPPMGRRSKPRRARGGGGCSERERSKPQKHTEVDRSVPTSRPRPLRPSTLRGSYQHVRGRASDRARGQNTPAADNQGPYQYRASGPRPRHGRDWAVQVYAGRLSGSPTANVELRFRERILLSATRYPARAVGAKQAA